MISKKTVNVYHLIELLDHMEKQGFASKQTYIQKHLKDRYRLLKDSYETFVFMSCNDDEELNSYNAEVRHLLDITEDEEVLMYIIW